MDARASSGQRALILLSLCIVWCVAGERVLCAPTDNVTQPPKTQPKAYVLPLKTHKLTVLLSASLSDKISSIKQDALSALKAPVLHAPNPQAESAMSVDGPAEPTIPKVTSVKDFELCRAIKERGRPTGKYELLEDDMQVRSCLTNWETLFVRFRNSDGEYFVSSEYETRLWRVLHPPVPSTALYAMAPDSRHVDFQVICSLSRLP